ncbi:MAG TPA: NfeD family protein [Propionibacterium sp.]|nr:NfeD family protein [Propionibacterium sp.]
MDWVRENLWAGWGVLAMALAAAELLTLDLTLLMLATGALAGGIVALVAPGLIWLQVVIALATAVATLFLLRPTLLAKVRSSKGYRSSLDNIIGAQGSATAVITGNRGEVKVDGQVWEARSFDPSITIEDGEQIEVFGIDGVTLSVYPTNRPLTQ